MKGIVRPMLFACTIVMLIGVQACAGVKPQEGGSGATGKPILIGMAYTMTGPYAGDAPTYEQGVELAVDEINAKGGLLGRPVEVVKFDTQDLAPERIAQAADYLANKGVDMFQATYGGWGQDVKAYGKYKQPMFHVDASTATQEVWEQSRYPNIFSVSDVEVRQIDDVWDAMMKLPYEWPAKRLALIAADDDWDQRGQAQWAKRAEEAGWEIVVRETVPFGTVEWGPILAKIRATNPTLISIDIPSTAELVTFYEQFMQQPTNTVINMGYGVTMPATIKEMGCKANGILGWGWSMPGPQPATAAAGELLDRYHAKYGADTEPGANVFVVYNSVMMWADAVMHVGDPGNYDAINKWLQTQTYIDRLGRNVYYNEDQITPIESCANTHIQYQACKPVTLFYNKGLQYADNVFEVPGWIK